MYDLPDPDGPARRITRAFLCSTVEAPRGRFNRQSVTIPSRLGSVLSWAFSLTRGVVESRGPAASCRTVRGAPRTGHAFVTGRPAEAATLSCDVGRRQRRDGERWRDEHTNGSPHSGAVSLPW